MKGSSKKTMLTAAVLVTLSSGTAFAATPGTVDAQDLFHSSKLITERVPSQDMKETTSSDSYEASISKQKKNADVSAAQTPAPTASAQRPTRLRWDNVDTRLAERSESPSFTLVSQKAKPVIITAEDVKREVRQAEKEGREPQQLVGRTNHMEGEGLPHIQVVPQNEPPRVMPPRPPVSPAQEPPLQSMPAVSHAAEMTGTHEAALQPHADVARPVPPPPAVQQPPIPQQDAVAAASGAGSDRQKPQRPRYAQLPHEEFSLMAPADTAAAPKQPDRFDMLNAPAQTSVHVPSETTRTVPAYTIRPEGVPEYHSDPAAYPRDEGLNGISDEVRRHILAGQLAMEIQLQRDPSVAGMRALTQVLRENTTLTRLQKIDFLIGFGRALHRSGLPRQQEALLIKTIADAF